MEIHRYFNPVIERYWFDCYGCKDWAQLDCNQDAWYYGTWADPKSRSMLCFAEGDITLSTAANDAEFHCMIVNWYRWAKRGGYKPGIDIGWDSSKSEAWKTLGLEHLLH